VFQIRGDVQDVIPLSGFVNSAEIKNQGGVVARRVSRVKSIKNDLLVK